MMKELRASQLRIEKLKFSLRFLPADESLIEDVLDLYFSR